jgi:hypothetical protein
VRVSEGVVAVRQTEVRPDVLAARLCSNADGAAISNALVTNRYLTMIDHQLLSQMLNSNNW